jgi:hypothetical protein
MPCIPTYSFRAIYHEFDLIMDLGLDNELFYMDKTMMVFGDAKKVVEDMVKSVS